MQSIRVALLAVGLTLGGAAPSAAITVIDFEGFAHGRVITTQITDLTVTADNIGGGADLAVIFDTDETATSDPDLEGPPNSTGWFGGNLGTNFALNNVLIIQENSTGCGDGICDDPDDEGTRPAGSLTLDFANPISFFGFDLVDMEGAAENGSITFASGGLNIASVGFLNFTDGLSPFFVPGAAFGNHTANRIPVNTFSSLNLSSFNRVIISMGGSGAIDNLMIPEPGAAALLGFGLLGLFAVGRRLRS